MLDPERGGQKPRIHADERMSDLVRELAVLALVAGNAFFVIGEYAVTARGAALASRAESGHAAARGAAPDGQARARDLDDRAE